MNTFSILRPGSNVRLRASLLCVLAFTLTLETQWICRGADAARTFASPDEAVAALAAAIHTQDVESLRSVLGTNSQELVNPDRVQATNEFRSFATLLDQNFRINHISETNCVLEVGADLWPFPVPIVKRDRQWFFDTAAGLEELLNRRIGKNELAVLEVMRAYVEAQREYAERDRDGDEVLEYAQKLASSPGKTDGLYWPTELNGQTSPLGPLVAEAQTKAYRLDVKTSDETRKPFHGYYFKILTQQGAHAPGGKYSYIINGNMIGGFAMVAWPAGYGDSGIMTFIVNQQGRVYQKDLGKETAKKAEAIKEYDPDETWMRSPD
jgi:hypothetical protein